MPPKTSPVSYAAKLHRVHCSPQATRVQFSGPIACTWRADGSDNSIKAAMAYRLAVCWNVLEGIPSSKLMDGQLVRLMNAVMAGRLDEAQTIVREWGDSVDMTNGRPNDCAGMHRT